MQKRTGQVSNRERDREKTHSHKHTNYLTTASVFGRAAVRLHRRVECGVCGVANVAWELAMQIDRYCAGTFMVVDIFNYCVAMSTRTRTANETIREA